MSQWDLDADALKSADRHYNETLALPDLQGLTDCLLPTTIRTSPGINDTASRETYADNIREIQDLLREIRFCTGTGLMLLLDGGRAQREAPLNVPPSFPGLFLDEADLAVLLINDNFKPPSALATDRHTPIGDGQSLGTWFGGMLLDTALLKSHGLLDRIVVALWCHAQLPIATTKAGQLKFPTYSGESLKQLKSIYGSDPHWPAFVELLDAPLTKELVRYRHGSTHQRRAGSVFNGGHERWHADHDHPDAPTHRVTRGMTAIEHANAPLATYREVIAPALIAANAMIQASFNQQHA
jgi:hypothetical protein